MKKTISVIGMIAVMALLPSCSSDDAPENAYGPVSIPEELQPMSQKANDFAFRLFKEVRSNPKYSEGNVCLSPYSMFTALCMTANGDNGQTHKEILRILGIENALEFENLNKYNRLLLEKMPHSDDISTYAVANSFWYAPEYQINAEFGNMMTGYYHASIFDQSPKGKEGMDRINSWVSEKTGKMLTDLIDSPKDWEAAIINAAYFKGKWQTPFLPENTKAGLFHNINGTDRNADFMHNATVSLYKEKEGVEFISLPYENARYEMLLFLPKESSDFSSYASTFDWENITSMTRTSETVKLNLAFPRFEAGTKDNFIQTIRAMGLTSNNMDAMFDNSDCNPELKDLIHGTKIIVNEEGTEASSSTAAGFIITDFQPNKEVTINFDRPFLYVIRECQTGLILFIGQQTNF